MLEKQTADSSSHIARQDIPEQYADVWSHRPVCAWQCLGKLRRRAHLLHWEPFPKPLTPKHPLTINNIGPLIALA